MTKCCGWKETHKTVYWVHLVPLLQIERQYITLYALRLIEGKDVRGCVFLLMQPELQATTFTQI